jgi:hypothetical protein
MSELLSNAEQLTEADLRRLEIIAGLHDDAMVWEDEINVVRKFMPALLAAARREQELASEVGVLLSEREDATLERIEHKKRIAELEAHNADLLKRFNDSLDRERVLIEHTVKLEALLDRVPHDQRVIDNLRCSRDCPRCAWEKMKGGGK